MSGINVINPLFNSNIRSNQKKTAKNIKLFTSKKTMKNVQNMPNKNRWSINGNHPFTSNNIMGLHTVKTNDWKINVGNNNNSIKLPGDLSLVRYNGSRHLVPKQPTLFNRIKKFSISPKKKRYGY
jgi:hypothetical protein